MKKRQVLSILSAFIVLISLSNAVIAQSDKKGGNETESKTPVWQAQADSFIESFELQKKDAAKLSKSYVKLRETVAEQNKEVSKKNDKEAYEVNADKNMAAGKEKLKKEIDKVLTAEQADEALLVLGSFSSRWDSYQKVLLDMNLKKEQFSAASKSLSEYMTVYLEARKIADDAGDRFSGRTATELKSNLDKALAGSLDEKQMEAWATATQRKKSAN